MAGYIGSKTSVTVTSPETDSRYVNVTGDTMTGALVGTDLTLSGGVYLGGTGAANKLDDYEEGTWTPTTATSGYTISSSSGFYTKVGNLVTLHFRVKFSAVATNNNFVRVQGRPFSPSLGIYQVGVGRDTTTTGAIYVAQMDLSGSNDIVLNSMDGVSGGVNRTFRINEDYDFNLTYRTS